VERFGKGLHNILEAACYGIPIFFGNKNFEKFQEAVDLINRGGAFEVSDYLDFKNKYENGYAASNVSVSLRGYAAVRRGKSGRNR
jgi:3-deoxy-D-manno-octulosonic-acid transferase